MPRLLLHTCCAPCLSAVEERLRDGYDLDIFWFNPNIYPTDEYQRRLSELNRLSEIVGKRLIVHEEPDGFPQWQAVTIDYANEPEGQRRCGQCIRYRLEKTAQIAKRDDYDIFSTTLSVSPHKNAKLINNVGSLLAQKYDIDFLAEDFKKHDGYLRSIELSKQYGLYRQEYCGCIYSMHESLARVIAAKKEAAPAGTAILTGTTC